MQNLLKTCKFQNNDLYILYVGVAEMLVARIGHRVARPFVCSLVHSFQLRIGN